MFFPFELLILVLYERFWRCIPPTHPPFLKPPCHTAAAAFPALHAVTTRSGRRAPNEPQSPETISGGRWGTCELSLRVQSKTNLRDVLLSVFYHLRLCREGGGKCKTWLIPSTVITCRESCPSSYPSNSSRCI